MAFADTLRSATVSWSDAATLMESLLSVGSYDSINSVVSTASTSFTGISGISLSVTVAAGQKVLLLGHGTCSHSAAGDVYFQHYRDSTAVGTLIAFQPRSSDVGGENAPWAIMGLDDPGAGTYTYTIQYKVNSGTGYVKYCSLIPILLRNS